MSQAASSATLIYSPTFGAGSPVPTPPARPGAVLGSLNLPLIVGGCVAAVALVLILKRKK